MISSASSKKADIFIRSYEKDFDWLKYCLRSIRKFCTGFNSVQIVVTQQDVHKLNFAEDEIVHGVHDKCEGYMAQQVTKMYADNFCNADFVLHVDSDCVFFKPTTPQNFFRYEKPVILYDEDIASPWPPISRITLGWLDNKEYMRRLPIIYPTWIYKEFRSWVKKNQKHDLETWICAQPHREYSEFNTLGQWAYKFHNDKFTWLKSEEHETYAIQHWSWGGIEQHKKKIEEILK